MTGKHAYNFEAIFFLAIILSWGGMGCAFACKSVTDFPPLPRDNVAVVLIDMQNDFLWRLSTRDKETIVTAQKKLIRTCAEKDIPLVVVEYEGGSKTIESLAEIIKEVPRVKTVFKTRDDGFLDTDLQNILSGFGVTTLVFAGIYEKACVQSTAESAIKFRFRVITAKGLIANPDYVPKTSFALEWYATHGILFCTVPEFL